MNAFEFAASHRRASRLAIAASLTVLLAACGGGSEGTASRASSTRVASAAAATQTESANEIVIPVTVVDGVIQVQESIDLRGKPENLKLRWVLNTSGWAFADDGIAIGGSDPTFSEGQVVNGGSAFEWKTRTMTAASTSTT
ncbi:hypothetical protein ACO2TI_15860 [Caldimonas sp. KR1-144]